MKFIKKLNVPLIFNNNKNKIHSKISRKILKTIYKPTSILNIKPIHYFQRRNKLNNNIPQSIDIIQTKINHISIKILSLNQIIQKQGKNKLKKYFQIANINQNELKQNNQNILKQLQKIKSFLNQNNQQTNQNYLNINLKQISHILAYFQQFFHQINIQHLKSQQLAIKIIKFDYQFIPALHLIQKCLKQKSYINDIYNNVQNSSLKENIFINLLGGQKQLYQYQQTLAKITNIAAASIIEQQKINNQIGKKILFGGYFAKYSLDYNKALLKSIGFYRKPNVNIISKIWNCPQMGYLKLISAFAFEHIMFNKIIWIPNEILDEKNNIFQPENGRIPIRILSHQQIQIYRQNNKKLNLQSKNKKILIHLHGGGFLAMSSHSMQIFTRRWANQLKIPIFCIDYRMPPQYPFPTPLQDCFNAYKFIVNHIKQFMDIDPQNIILAGDSAGGNLACALIGMILKNGLKIPKGLFLAYPAMDLRMNYSPSYFNSFTDPVMKPSLLVLCLNEYLGYKSQKSNNPLASPILLTQSFIKNNCSSTDNEKFPLQWPKTIIFVGAKDPLYDDSLKLASKLSQNKIKFKLHIYKNFSHGFLNLSFLIPQCDEIINDSCKQIKKTFLQNLK